jgi:hypothetical protein
MGQFPPPRFSEGLLGWQHSDFSVHKTICVEADDIRGLAHRAAA